MSYHQEPPVRHNLKKKQIALDDENDKQKTNSTAREGGSSNRKSNLNNDYSPSVAYDSPDKNVFDNAIGNPEYQAQLALFKDQEEINDQVKSFNQNYNKGKNSIDQGDLSVLGSGLESWTLELCYEILDQNLAEDDPDFDNERMGPALKNLQNQQKESAEDFAQFKGQFLRTNQACINKDNLTLTPESVQDSLENQIKVMKKQADVIETLEDVGSQTANLKRKYENFERDKFETKMSDIKKTSKQCNQKAQEVEEQNDDACTTLAKAKDSLKGCVAATPGQKSKLASVTKDLNLIEKRLQQCLKKLRSEKDCLKGLNKDSEECQDSCDDYKSQHLEAMITQTRKIELLCKTHKELIELYKRLKAFDEEIETLNFDLTKKASEVKNFVDSINDDNKQLLDELAKKVKKLYKELDNDLGDEADRLKETGDKLKDSPLSDADKVNLQKDLNKCKAILDTCKAQADDADQDTDKIVKKVDNQEDPVSQAQCDAVKNNLDILEKIKVEDLPKVQNTIDALDNFNIKSIKNQLNEENKKSQQQIAEMKKDFEDLQKQIDALNTKLSECKNHEKDLKGSFKNKDLERENFIKKNVTKPIAECEKDIYGDKLSTDEDDTMVAIKKKVIQDINTVVNRFNENNKNIKEVNKNPKSDKEMKQLVQNNKEIQEECDAIDKKIGEGKDLAEVIDEALDKIMKTKIPDSQDKFDDKNKLLGKCDELYDDCESGLTKYENKINEQEKAVQGVIDRLDAVSPENNPGLAGTAPMAKMIDDKANEAKQLKYKLVGHRQKLDDLRDKLYDTVQPINELPTREVDSDEIIDVMREIEKIMGDCDEKIDQLKPIADDIEKLAKAIEQMLDSDTERKLYQAQSLLPKLEAKNAMIEQGLKDQRKQLKKYQDMDKDAIEKFGPTDPALKKQLQKLLQDSEPIEEELDDIDKKLNKLKKNTDNLNNDINDMLNNIDKYNPASIVEVLDGANDQIKVGNGLSNRLGDIDMELEEKIYDLEELLAAQDDADDLRRKVQALADQITNDIDDQDTIIREIPQKIKKIIAILREMEDGSEPDESADYWEERGDIERWIKKVLKEQDKEDALRQNLTDFRDNIERLENKIKKTQDLQELTKAFNQLEDTKEEIIENLNKALDVQSTVNNVHKEMDDCCIPGNIARRKNEVDQFCERLAQFQEDFRDLKQADESFEGRVADEAEVKKDIYGLERELKSLEEDKKEHKKFLKSPLDLYTNKDFYGLDCDKIITEVNDFRLRIKKLNGKLKKAAEKLGELNDKLVQQDIDNALKIMEKKNGKLRERLAETEEALKKIQKCGDEMDGNTTHNEEDEFIDALKDEMPDVLDNIKQNFKELDEIDKLIKEVKKSKNPDTVNEIKRMIDDATEKIDQSNALAEKLENEIIEWNPLKKLCRRDQELEDIDQLLGNFKGDLDKENEHMERELSKNKKDLEGDEDRLELKHLRDGIINYMDDIKELKDDVNALKKQKDDVFEGFDDEIPAPVKVQRLKRRDREDGGRRKLDPNDPSHKIPKNPYYMISTNCKYKPRIHQMLKQLRKINQRRKELAERYEPLKRDLSHFKEAQLYKAIKGDEIDEMFGKVINDSKLSLTVKRLSSGKYMFGTKHILAKIINGKLVIRVGGGYMNAEEFIEQYGKLELMKMMRIEEKERKEGSVGRQSSVGRMSAASPNRIGIGEMREQMKGSMYNMKTYDDKGKVTDQGKTDFNGLKNELKASFRGDSPNKGFRQSSKSPRGVSRSSNRASRKGGY